MKAFGLVVLLSAAAGSAFAGVHTVPEIDPVAGVGALAMLSGALLVIRGRRRSNHTR